MTKTQRILTAVALAAGASALAASGASAAGHTDALGGQQLPAGAASLDQLDQLGQVTGLVAPVTGLLGAFE